MCKSIENYNLIRLFKKKVAVIEIKCNEMEWNALSVTVTHIIMN